MDMGLFYEAERPMLRDNHFANRKLLSVLLDRSLLTLSAVTTAILFAWLIYYSSCGLDLEWEGFHLNSIANPFAYTINSPPTLFGFVYHWPYQWAGGDIAVLRMANVTLTMALGWILSFLTIRRLWTVGWPHAAILSAGIASMGFVDFRFWLLTPSYYELSFHSLLMVMIGLLLADRSGRARQVLGWILVGVGGWCCFMAKPTTAAGIALVVMIYVVVLRRKLLLPMLYAALLALALLIVTAFLIDGRIAGLLTRMVNSTEMIILLGDGHGMSLMFRIDWLPTSRSQLAIAVSLAIALLLSILMESTHKLFRSLALAAVLVVTIEIALLGIDPIALLATDPISTKVSTLFLVPAFISLGAMFYREGLVLRTQAPTSIALALAFLVLPHLYALGTAGHYWVIGSKDALFWMLAAVAFLSPLAQQGPSVAILLPLTVLAQLLTASVVNGGILQPYGQVGNLRAYTAVTPMPGGGKLVLSQSLHDYLATAKAQARAAGLEVGTPVIDLTGRSPGLVYVLETRSLGLPSLMGGFSGSSAVAVETLGLESCVDLAKAWILIEPEGPRHLDRASVMASFGSGQADYVAAATFESPVNDGDFPNAYRQFLLKPTRPAALAEQSCHETRRQQPHSQKWRQWWKL
ncbi:hypothetical protein J2R76_003819 [Bradyrhizobium sp. USDA 4532]|uniref:hypothetical protein n=1 Tax=unclassified Bradyrhizobium TaxID=2631580 RepID=UPI0020A1CFEF|nr:MULTISPECIES: hypothetical protein [unclassified Bradyrhizobium]MCP1835482.1 hypothetical protein [Bradyrhizobium sp. USDA 4545]MCP1920228.1 hypothetical protein [Bradyrhizobium sp. USDA 4532]